MTTVFKKLKNLFKPNKREDVIIEVIDTPVDLPKDVPVEVEINQKKSLFISAGHSDIDAGASRVHGGVLVTEAQIVTEFRDLLAEELNDLGVAFTMDGVKGENLPLTSAIQLAKEHDVSVEFHCNSFDTGHANGVETLSGDKHRVLGGKLCEAISGAMGARNRGAKAEDSGQHSRLGFISKGKGIIVELFFISSPKDYASYVEHKSSVVKAVAEVLYKEVT